MNKINNILDKTNSFPLQRLGVLIDQFEGKSPEEILSYFLKEFKGKIALSSSLSIEDQVLTDLITNIDKQTRIFTLDTGRLFPETYTLIDSTNKKYGINIELIDTDEKAGIL